MDSQNRYRQLVLRLFGAVAAGDAGAQRALEILHDELLRTMRLCGTPTVAQLSADLLRPTDAIQTRAGCVCADSSLDTVDL